MSMTGARGRGGRVVGGALALLGFLSLWEGWRLHALRTQMVAGAVVGDDTFPFIVGAALLLLGASLLVAKLPQARVAAPYGEQRMRMMLGAGVLAAYWIIVPHLGYTGSTALVSTGLFRAMGGYRWPRALLLGGVTTGRLYLLFRVWLLQPLPTGFLGL
jgi:Tripartite tricarboxylate transporter TctB family